jgi:hypothetical protein
MRYFASPILTSFEGVHDADLADEDALAPPGQQACPFPPVRSRPRQAEPGSYGP